MTSWAESPPWADYTTKFSVLPVVARITYWNINEIYDWIYENIIRNYMNNLLNNYSHFYFLTAIKFPYNQVFLFVDK